ncbi:unnamed protein product, partial [Laminaria digitata]
MTWLCRRYTKYAYDIYPYSRMYQSDRKCKVDSVGCKCKVDWKLCSISKSPIYLREDGYGQSSSNARITTAVVGTIHPRMKLRLALLGTLRKIEYKVVVSNDYTKKPNARSAIILKVVSALLRVGR